MKVLVDYARVRFTGMSRPQKRAAKRLLGVDWRGDGGPRGEGGWTVEASGWPDRIRRIAAELERLR